MFSIQLIACRIRLNFLIAKEQRYLECKSNSLCLKCEIKTRKSEKKILDDKKKRLFIEQRTTKNE